MPTLPQIQLAEYQISQDLQDFLEGLEDSLLTPEEQQQQIEEFFQQFITNEEQLKDKISRACYYLARLEKETEYYDDQAERFLSLSRATERRQSSLKKFVERIIESKGGTLPTKDFPKLKLKATQASVIVDPNFPIEEIPERFLKPIKAREISKTAIADALRVGIELGFAKFSEKGKTLIGWK